MNTALEVFSDLSERLRYNHPDFPVYVQYGMLGHFEGYSAACHWHPDLEFLAVLEGHMSYFVNGKIVELGPGEGIFVNSQRLHYGFSRQGTDCHFLVLAFHPILLFGSSPALAFTLKAAFGPDRADYLLLQQDDGWQSHVLETIRLLATEISATPPSFLKITARLMDLLERVADHLTAVSEGTQIDESWMTVWTMRSFIQQKYGSKISLDEIAASGAVCRSLCCQLFLRHLGESPIRHLNHYRISRACEMLRDSSRSVSEIASACGFQTTSYFSSVFRKELGCMPTKYRRD